MDELDRKIIRLMTQNARMPVKDIAQEVNLTSPAVSSRIRRLEQEGIISGYTVVLRPPESSTRVEALIFISAKPEQHSDFLALLEHEPQVLQCFRVTGSYSYIVKANCADIESLESLITDLQEMGSTSTQIILSTPVNRQLSY